MSATLFQVMGFVIGLLGVAGITACTGMDMWSTEDLSDNPVTAINTYAGLWRSCVRQSSGFTECRPYFTILGLPALDMWSIEDRSYTVITSVYAYFGLWRSCVESTYGTTQCRPYFTILGLPGLFQAVRALMIVGIVLGVIATMIGIFALKCLKIGNMEDNVKATMTLTTGIMFALAGICAIAGVSIFANLIVTNFMMTTWSSSAGGPGGFGNTGFIGSPLTPRYTFGSALFVGWVGGGLLVVGGVLMCVACRSMMPEKQRYETAAYKAATYRSEDKSKNYNDSYRAQSTVAAPNQKYDYV
ncbi:Claudin-18 [Triplophysa tibetana]|uniref:Claudin-18 n=1 Tax=Triplophysa tibetana TaxID=1572043 RepID=A0A5A9NXJ8_9TELE|nr:Claudin-18 [Triplophysa tibetana]